MPRPKTDLTGSNTQIHARVTAPLKAEYFRLGGSAWLRKMLAQSIEQRQQKEPTR